MHLFDWLTKPQATSPHQKEVAERENYLAAVEGVQRQAAHRLMLLDKESQVVTQRHGEASR